MISFQTLIRLINLLTQVVFPFSIELYHQVLGNHPVCYFAKKSKSSYT